MILLIFFDDLYEELSVNIVHKVHFIDKKQKISKYILKNKYILFILYISI